MVLTTLSNFKLRSSLACEYTSFGNFSTKPGDKRACWTERHRCRLLSTHFAKTMLIARAGFRKRFEPRICLALLASPKESSTACVMIIPELRCRIRSLKSEVITLSFCAKPTCSCLFAVRSSKWRPMILSSSDTRPSIAFKAR